ncbi:amino acid adenylation domain-containing protein [Labedaea rhizosphaerae]|uniref:Amino acid adenylation domain-containing protein n=1 Tax=Labedaea rhizosphaerae TaxID=598644 RepID=A0A4R6S2S8_LABRH|nr:amino acid adenylation domain-containing protein [Labedaea rhizosphaerae]TDP92956.1 amino acid adenylation domain-containing protein [Labedaea rhizosphaerae]
MSSKFPGEPWASVVDLFEARVAAAPDSIAVVDADGTRLSYQDVNAAANRLARHLKARGVGPEVRVALVLHRSARLVVALLAVLKAGGTYVPVDPENSDHRIGHVFANSAPVLTLTTDDLVHRLPSGAAHLLVDAPEIAEQPADDLPCEVVADNTQYVIYTSGSTGTPKGVAVSHGNVVRLFTATAATFGFGPADVWTLFHSYSFDFSVWELWGALLHGGRLVIVSKETARSTPAFLDLLAGEGVTVLNQTPSAFAQLMHADREHPAPGLALRYVILGGEAVEPALLADWYGRHADDAPVIVNGYGITETTVFATFRPMDEQFARAGNGSYIGDAIADLPVHLLDDDLQQVGVGVQGEIFIGGAGVARGYLGRPGLTAERFMPDPFGVPGARLYRSGDLARHTADGELEFLGRADSQVKIRGFRIELGEIEVVVSACPLVGQAAVVVREDKPGDKRIVAYVVPSGGAAQAGLPGAVQQFALDRLPHYMIPSTVVVIDAIPLTTNGKLDTAALPAPAVAAADAPETATERAVAPIWADLLEHAAVGRTDHYLELGGHSLTAARIVARVRADLRVDVQVRDIYDNPVLTDFARRVDQLRAQGAPARPALRRIARTASVGGHS